MEGRSSTAPADDTSKTERKLHSSNRYTAVLFQDEQARQHSETHFNPATGIVTMSLLVQDPNGYFIPNVWRENLGTILLNSSGVDTLGKAPYRDALRVAAGPATSIIHAQSNEEMRQ